ncbi:hypothetical protein [Nonomuraea sp. NPDC050643]|uniref:hypothetical protein n=1 Tax=Nonomuraea sp. NPDC050643 TaxID=3155660 RepID=UPI00340901A5
MNHVLELRYRRLAGGFAVRAQATRAYGVPPRADGLHLGVLIVAGLTFAELPVLPQVNHPAWAALGIAPAARRPSTCFPTWSAWARTCR